MRLAVYVCVHPCNADAIHKDIMQILPGMGFVFRRGKGAQFSSLNGFLVGPAVWALLLSALVRIGFKLHALYARTTETESL